MCSGRAVCSLSGAVSFIAGGSFLDSGVFTEVSRLNCEVVVNVGA